MQNVNLCPRGVPDVFDYSLNLLEKEELECSPFVYGMDVFRLKAMLNRGYLFPETDTTLMIKGIFGSYERIWPDGYRYMYYGIPQMNVLQERYPSIAQELFELNSHDRDLQGILNQSVREYATNAATRSWFSRYGVNDFDYYDAMYLIRNYHEMKLGKLGSLVDEAIQGIFVAMASSEISLDDLYYMAMQAIRYTGVLVYFGSHIPASSMILPGVETGSECLIFTNDVLRPYNIDAIRLSEYDLDLLRSLTN